MTPQISIIVPVYNTEQYLSRCVDSILIQSYKDFELILVDDGSTDGGGKICDTYAEKDNRVRVFHKENRGVSSARNMGLDKAQGDWVCFLDSDDELMPDGLQLMTECVSNNVDLVMCGYEVLDEDGTNVYSIENRICKNINNVLAIKEMYCPADYRYQGYVCSKMFRMSVIKDNSLKFAEDVYFNEDRLFVTQFICLSGREVSYNTAPVYKYIERQNSAMMSLKKSFNPRFASDIEAQIRMRELIRKNYEDEELNELADFGVYHSYKMITGVMKQTHYENDLLKSQLRSRQLDIIGRWKYIRFEIQCNGRKVLKKICSIIGWKM